MVVKFRLNDLAKHLNFGLIDFNDDVHLKLLTLTLAEYTQLWFTTTRMKTTATSLGSTDIVQAMMESK
jgi:hypothetical protein